MYFTKGTFAAIKAAAKAIAGYCANPTRENILPYTLDKKVVPAVAKAVAQAARESGVCRQ